MPRIPQNLKSIYMRSGSGDMIQMENLVDLKEDIAPPRLYRYNRFVSATVSAGLGKGYTLGQALDEMDKIAKETLDDTFRTALTGESKDFRESSNSLLFAFGLALLLIYLILAAQFESFKDQSFRSSGDAATAPTVRLRIRQSICEKNSI